MGSGGLGSTAWSFALPRTGCPPVRGRTSTVCFVCLHLLPTVCELAAVHSVGRVRTR